MTRTRTSREITMARSVPGQNFSRIDAHLTVESMREGGLEIRFATPSQLFAELEEMVTSIRRELAARLPEALRSLLATETGVVRSTVWREDGENKSVSWRYAMATLRGVILGIGSPDNAASFATLWDGTVEAAEIDPGRPVVLSPSAALTLVAYALETSALGTFTSREEPGRPPMTGLTVTDTADCPYPPQHYPFGGDGRVSRDRPLLREGKWCVDSESVGGDVDPIFFLLTRPEQALRPLAASSYFVRRNLSVYCDKTVESPSPALIVDSWRMRVGPRSGAVPFDAEISCVDPERGRLACTTPLRLCFDPWQALARIRGACGPELPAVDEDPIEGDAYGLVPSLAMDLTLDDLLEEGGSS